MARCIPKPTRGLLRMTAGDRCVAWVLHEKLDAAALVGYDVVVGDRCGHADFIVLDSHLGWLVLGGKDWHPEIVLVGDRDRVGRRSS
jgi:hypothetical protein